MDLPDADRRDRQMDMKQLNREYRDIIEKKPEKHQLSGKQELEYMQNSTARYHERVIRTLYMAKLFPTETVHFLQEQAETMHRILVKVIEEYLSKPDFRSLFGFSKEYEELILQRPGYNNLLPMARLDIFFNEETSQFKFCEFNADGTSAMNEDRELNIAFRQTEAYKNLSKKYQCDSFELFDSWVQEVSNIYESYPQKVDKPVVGIVDFLEKGHSTYEFNQFRQAFEKAGFRTYICEIREMTYDGRHLYSGEGEAIDLIYRRAVTSDVFENRSEISAFLQAVRDDAVCVIGNFCTQVVHDKTLFRVLRHKRCEAFLTEREIQFVKEHIPGTWDLTKENIRRNKVIAEKNNWLIKPKNSYAARGVYAGINFSRWKWKRLLKKYQKENYVLQEFIMPYKSDNIDYSNADPEFKKYTNMTGMYMYNGRLAGFYSRQADQEIISGIYGEYDLASVQVSLLK